MVKVFLYWKLVNLEKCEEITDVRWSFMWVHSIVSDLKAEMAEWLMNRIRGTNSAEISELHSV